MHRHNCFYLKPKVSVTTVENHHTHETFRILRISELILDVDKSADFIISIKLSIAQNMSVYYEGKLGIRE